MEMNGEKMKQNVTQISYRLPSSDGKSSLYIMMWRPEKEVRAVLQISHGMIEHMGRYDEFARTLAESGIAVAGHDHLGHGKTSRKEDYGYFADDKGDICMIRDIRRVKTAVKKMYPNVPYFFLGHSMGSFFLRKYLMAYGKDGDGAILMGTGDQPLVILLAGMDTVCLTGCIRGRRYRSPLLHNLVLGKFDRTFRKEKEKGRWISGDKEKVKEYKKDPMCQFIFTCGAYRDFFKIMLDLKHPFWLRRLPPDMPLLLLSGEEDPVGEKGRGIRRLWKKMKKLGISDIHMHLYKGCRHEILNEKNRDQVYKDVLIWLNIHIVGAKRDI